MKPLKGQMIRQWVYTAYPFGDVGCETVKCKYCSYGTSTGSCNNCLLHTYMQEVKEDVPLDTLLDLDNDYDSDKDN